MSSSVSELLGGAPSGAWILTTDLDLTGETARDFKVDNSDYTPSVGPVISVENDPAAATFEIGATGLVVTGTPGVNISGAVRTSPLWRMEITELVDNPLAQNLLRIILFLTVTPAGANTGAAILMEDDPASSINNKRTFVGEVGAGPRIGAQYTNAGVQATVGNADVALPTVIDIYCGFGGGQIWYGTQSTVPTPFSLTAVTAPFGFDVNAAIDITNDARLVVGAVADATVTTTRIVAYKGRLL